MACWRRGLLAYARLVVPVRPGSLSVWPDRRWRRASRPAWHGLVALIPVPCGPVRAGHGGRSPVSPEAGCAGFLVRARTSHDGAGSVRGKAGLLPGFPQPMWMRPASACGQVGYPSVFEHVFYRLMKKQPISRRCSGKGGGARRHGDWRKLLSCGFGFVPQQRAGGWSARHGGKNIVYPHPVWMDMAQACGQREQVIDSMGRAYAMLIL